MPSARWWWAGALLAWLAACSGANGEPPAGAAVSSTGEGETAWRFESAVDGLRQASCPPGARPEPFETITLQTQNVELGVGSETQFATKLRYAGGVHLTSPDKRLGGLSGLDATPDGLVAVSDSGDLIFFDLDHEEDLKLGPTARLSRLKDSSGRALRGKTKADAEGITFHKGMAFVSFERDHRVLAFDLEMCGVGARGVELARVPSNAPGLTHKIPRNHGAEAITLLDNGSLLIGLEQIMQGSPVGRLGADGSFLFTDRLSGAEGIAITGLAQLDEQLFSVHRSYAPGIGNRIAIVAHLADDEGYASTQLAILVPPQNVDNFEGIAAYKLRDGTVRLYVVSDDNFSARQRTLLMAFDVPIATAP